GCQRQEQNECKDQRRRRKECRRFHGCESWLSGRGRGKKQLLSPALPRACHEHQRGVPPPPPPPPPELAPAPPPPEAPPVAGSPKPTEAFIARTEPAARSPPMPVSGG